MRFEPKAFFTTHLIVRNWALYLLFLSLFFPPLSMAVLKINIDDSQEGKIPIAILPFVGEGKGPRNYSGIIAFDLELSGQFAALKKDFSGLPTELKNRGEGYTEWRKQGIERFVFGKVSVSAATNLPEVSFELHDSIREQLVLAKSFSLHSMPKRLDYVSRLAHTISNSLYQNLSGQPGIFTSKMAFVSSEKRGSRKRTYRLCLSDIDGHNIFVLLTSVDLLMSPAWSPRGNAVVYVAYINNSPELFIKYLNRTAIQSLAHLTGPAFAPAWSRDGRYLAYTGLRDGNSEIYTLALATKQVRRITDNLAIDTEPAWTPSGELYFTSDRSGFAQIYKTSTQAPKSQRVTFAGSYNSDAAVSPDGTRLAFLTVRDGRYAIALRNLTDKSELILSGGHRDEGARFLGNGFLLGFLSGVVGQSAIGIATIDGVLGKQFTLQASNVRTIAWSPLRR